MSELISTNPGGKDNYEQYEYQTSRFLLHAAGIIAARVSYVGKYTLHASGHATLEIRNIKISSFS